jgi:rhodanese-related sulfurtransferase
MNLAGSEIQGGSTMREVLAAFPGAQRALFRHYHVGGCSACAFQPDETLNQVCQRNGSLPVADVLAQIRASHEEDALLLIEPRDLAELVKQDPAVQLLDVRSREEFEAVRLEGSVLLSQPVMREILAQGAEPRPLVIIDHQGRQALDAAAYFLGQGLKQVRCLRGGIDAWAQEVQPELRRYRLG